MASADIVITGAGVIGLTLALELRERGLSVILLERGKAGSQASSAAAGMLAVHDRANPPALELLAKLSLQLYPASLDRLREQGGHLSFETSWTLEMEQPDQPPASLQAAAEQFGLHPELSLDPRKLIAALLRTARLAGIDLREDTPALNISEQPNGVVVRTPSEYFSASHHIDCTGAWSPANTRPAKGQMLRVALPAGLMHLPGRGNVVVRTPEVYIVPRLDGTAIVGATIEDTGFDTVVLDTAMADLRKRAATILPGLASAPETERWAGLRPRTPDDLPLLGQTGARRFVAAGHFRNGILLAPATAQVIADLVLGQPPSIDLSLFAPSRFESASGRDDNRTNDRL